MVIVVFFLFQPEVLEQLSSIKELWMDGNKLTVLPAEGNLRRYPTPYPDELKNMVKTAQSVAHRLKEDESGDETLGERNHIGVIEPLCTNGKAHEPDSKAVVPDLTPAEPRDVPDITERIPLRSPENTAPSINSEDTLEESEELSSDEEEMKIAEMRPPLIEISINQPKVVALSKDKKGTRIYFVISKDILDQKEFLTSITHTHTHTHTHTLMMIPVCPVLDDSKDADSLLDETVANSNQNNSNCSSPSRMSDSVSLTTDSSQDNSLCTPERETKIPLIPKNRQEDENLNQLKETLPLLQNCNDSETSLQKIQHDYQSKTGSNMSDYQLSMEERLALIEKDINNGVSEPYSRWDQINMNVSYENTAKTKSVSTAETRLSNNNGSSVENLNNGNQNGKAQSGEGMMKHEVVRMVMVSGDVSLSRSTDELTPEKRCPPATVIKSQSISNMEAGGMKLYSVEGEVPPYECVVGSPAVPGPQCQSIVRSKSASLLDEQPLQVHPASSGSSSDLLSSRVPARYPVAPPPQYNVQYASSTVPKENLWCQRTPVPPDQLYLPPQHSFANTNFSNRNNAPSYPPHQQRGPPKTPDVWAKDRVLPAGVHRNPLQRQGSTSSNASMVLVEPRRMPGPDGDYVSYRDIHSMPRAPLQLNLQRPLSARTYSVDEGNGSHAHTTRPPPNEFPERTMSVCDFSYHPGSPSKRPNVRVKSEHSLLDGAPGGAGRVPADWRNQVMRHIEAKKMEKMDESFGPYGQQGYPPDPHRKVPLMNGQMCSPPPPLPPAAAPPLRSQVPMARHPSREQLIDYLMLKVSQQPPCAPRHPHDTLPHEGIFVTRVQADGPASKLLQPGDKIIQANGYNFVNIDHVNAVSLLKNFPSTVELIIIRDMAA
ncbi:Erbin [Bagarius yarrelli]|uniref:Erbin n=1 Tax=Bagarius yarrelli TaxID=175774 RepID=A0A556VBH5_BAGYA|nr:Erbin [Bagarius yarrelli]